MQNLICSSIAILLLVFLFNSCQEGPTAVQNDVTGQQGSGEFSKPSPGKLTCSLVVTPHDPLNPVALPVFPVPSPKPVKIHYEISGPNPIASATIYIIYDDNKDGKYNVSYAERVRKIYIPCDGTQPTMSGDTLWNGEVDAAYSATGYLFDQFASDNPDCYLFHFDVLDSRGGYALNDAGASPDFARAYITPTQTVAEFHIASVAPSSTPRKGRYVAELKATVTCESEGAPASQGFKGCGYWAQVDANGDEHTPSVYSGNLVCSYVDDGDEDAAGTTSAALLVGPGTYRYHAVLQLRSPYYSYKPLLSIMIQGDITVP
jgi:hypothetical protein